MSEQFWFLDEQVERLATISALTRQGADGRLLAAEWDYTGPAERYALDAMSLRPSRDHYRPGTGRLKRI